MNNLNTTKRNYYLDNLKFVLITLVVVGHFAMKMTYVDSIKYIMYFIYLFHMPCFIFINGFLAKKMNSGGKLRVDKILITLWLYLIFKLGTALLSYVLGQETQLRLFKENSAPWYLLALTIWYLSVPFLERINVRYLIPGSFLIGLIAGYINSLGGIMALSRVFAFFPFFIIGFSLPAKGLEEFLDKKRRLPAVLVLITVLILLVIFFKQLKPFLEMVYGSTYKQALEELAPYGALVRAAWYVLAVVTSMAVMVLVPRGRLFFTVLGERTMQVYMIHIWVRNGLLYVGFFNMLKEKDSYLSLLVLLGSIVLTFLLSNSWFKKLYDILMSPKLVVKILNKTEE